MTSRTRAGRIVPRNDNADAQRALDSAFRAAQVSRRFVLGPACAEMLFAGDNEAVAYESALLRASPANRKTDFSIAVLHGHLPQLDVLLPGERKNFRFASDGAMSSWWVPEPWPTFFLYDHRFHRGLQWVFDPSICEGLRTHPCLLLLHAHFARTAWVPLHAAAAGLDGRFLLMAGPGGSGKSTASLACAMSGWHYAGDDFVLVEPSIGDVAPLFVSGRVRPGSQSALRPLLVKTEVARSNELDDPRAELRLRPEIDGIRIGGGRISAILLPRRRGAVRVTFTPASAADTVKALLEPTVTMLPGLRGSLFPKLLAAVKSAPRYFVDTGDNPAAIPDAFKLFLSTL